MKDSTQVSIRHTKDYNIDILGKAGINTSKNLSIFVNELHKRLEADLHKQTDNYYYQEQKKQKRRCINLTDNNISRANVLLVEDSKIIRIVNSGYLHDIGCTVDIAEDGKQALDLLQNQYDLILLDIGLPDIDGIEICKWIRANKINTPVIFLTAYGEIVKEECMSVGGNDFAVKPLSKEKFQELISKWLANDIRSNNMQQTSSVKIT